MKDPGGGSGTWCPDCGTVIIAGQRHCTACGLDYQAAAAREIERANAAIHTARARLAETEALVDGWLAHRRRLLAGAPRAAGSRPLAAMTGGPEDAASTPALSAVLAPALAPALDPVVAPALDPVVAPAHATSPAPQQASPMRAPRSVSAAGLLGVASAALFVLAGIVFVAASWSTYGPFARMVILACFSLMFAWMARTATKHTYADVGGALGVVSAAFVGVAVVALDLGPDGVDLFTPAWASLGVAVAGLHLARQHIKAVGPMAAGAVLVAVVAAAVDVASAAGVARESAPLSSLVLACGVSLLLLTRRAWPSVLQRRIVTSGALLLGAFGAVFAVASPTGDHPHGGLSAGALAASLVVWAGVSLWRPRWGAGVLVGLVTLAAPAWMAYWDLTWGHAALACSVAVVACVVGLRLAPPGWWAAGSLGLTVAVPLLLILWVGGLSAATVPVVVAGVSLAAGDGWWAWIGSGWWHGASMVVVASAALGARVRSNSDASLDRWNRVGCIVFATGTVVMGVEGVGTFGAGRDAVGLALVAAAALQWMLAPVWRGPAMVVARSVAVAVLVAAAVHSVTLIAWSEELAADVSVAAAGAALSMAALALAAVRVKAAAGLAAGVLLLGASALTWNVTSSAAATTSALAMAALAAQLVALALRGGREKAVRAACLIALAAAVPVAMVTADAVRELYLGEGAVWRPEWLAAVAACTVAAVASRRGWAAPLPVVVTGLAASAFLVPDPLGYAVLAGLSVPLVELGVRGGGRRGASATLGISAGLVAMVATGGGVARLAIAAGALGLAALLIVIRVRVQSQERDAALMLATLASSSAVALGLIAGSVPWKIAVVVAAGVALTMPLVAVATRRDPEGRVAMVMLAAASFGGSVLVADAVYAAVVLLIASSAWFGLTALGVRWARWVSLGLLTPAAGLLAAAAGWDIVEAYTVVPALSLLGVGLWWLRRDPSLRTYAALAPGLGVALVPSFGALFADPEALWRPGMLLTGAVVLAGFGVALRWFAPLLSTAIIGVVVALAQVVAENELVPRWLSAAFIAGVLLGLAFIAERIKEMR